MSLKTFERLHADADARGGAVPVAVPGAADRTVLEALCTARDRGWVTPLLIGRQLDICRVAAACGADLHGMEILDSEEPVAAAVAQVQSGRASVLMKGQVTTPTLLHGILDPASGLRTSRVVCQVVLMEIWPAVRSFLLADTGICVHPTLKQKIDILHSAVETARALQVEIPRVAVMAATETVHASMPETLDAAEIQRRNQAGELPACHVQGPLSFDLAYAADAGEKKHVGGPVTGAADILLFPNLLSANLTVKAIMYTSDSRFGGILCGAACPIAFMSRADTTSTRLNSLALALNVLGQTSE
jgi:phosphate butyryltransferase